MYKSRIAEDIQLRMTQPFAARGEKELETRLEGLPWHCYLPDPTKNADMQFKMPQTRAKSYKSKLFHTQLIRDILIDTLTENQVRKEFKMQQLESGKTNYKTFKKEWIAKKLAKEKKEVEALAKEKLKQKQKDQDDGSVSIERKIKSLDQVRAELVA